METTTDTRGPAEQGREPGSDERDARDLRAALDQMGAHLRGAVLSMRRSLYLGRGALQLALFDKAFHLGAVVAAAAIATAMTITSLVLTVLGIRRGLDAWTGGAWWIDLALAAGVLGTTAASALAYYRWMHGSILSATRAKLSAAEAEDAEAARPS